MEVVNLQGCPISRYLFRFETVALSVGISIFDTELNNSLLVDYPFNSPCNSSEQMFLLFWLQIQSFLNKSSNNWD